MHVVVEHLICGPVGLAEVLEDLWGKQTGRVSWELIAREMTPVTHSAGRRAQGKPECTEHIRTRLTGSKDREQAKPAQIGGIRLYIAAEYLFDKESVQFLLTAHRPCIVKTVLSPQQISKPEYANPQIGHTLYLPARPRDTKMARAGSCRRPRPRDARMGSVQQSFGTLGGQSRRP